mmetsp:Transcript_9256/g.4895  ORF Transcript_9256/g.4895 Transcript_9256/m.4895 type:complete len:101 (+) Transcript_9256:696-998(+)
MIAIKLKILESVLHVTDLLTHRLFKNIAKYAKKCFSKKEKNLTHLTKEIKKSNQKYNRRCLYLDLSQLIPKIPGPRSNKKLVLLVKLTNGKLKAISSELL